jgi:hypothetical protein
LIWAVIFRDGTKQFKALEPPVMMKRATVTEAFDIWLAGHDATKSDTIPVFIVAGQGGGSRAAYWMSKTMLLLDSVTDGAFHRHCFAISTVSGSSPGTVATLAFWDSLAIQKDFYKQDKNWQFYPKNVFNKNYITSGLAGNFFGDFLQKITLLPIKDRNVRLQEEEAWCVERALNAKGIINGGEFNIWNSISKEVNPNWYLHRSYIHTYYDDKGVLKHNPDLPYFIANTCNVQTGKRGIVSPFYVDDSIFVEAIDVLGLAIKNKDTMTLRDDKVVNLTLGQASNITELFPYVSAAGSIYNMTFVDGGYFENYGLATASEIYRALQAHIAQKIAQTANDTVTQNRYKRVKMNVLAIINSDGELLKNKLENGRLKPTSQALAPIMATFNVHFGGYASKVRTEIKRTCGEDHYYEYVFKGDVPLSRILTEGNVQDMDSLMYQNLKKLPPSIHLIVPK